MLQGIDASGKDGCVKHVMTGFNPAGVSVTSFKVPSEVERGHDYLWRVHPHIPGNGEISIFNRSHDGATRSAAHSGATCRSA